MGVRASVIVTAYRRVPLLEQALRSVLAQTVRDFDVVIVNDCPEDREAVDGLVCELNDARLRVIHQGESRGANIARNVAIGEARGEILCFLDDDDSWYPAKLEKHLAMHAEGPHVGIVYSNARGDWLDVPLPSLPLVPGPAPIDLVGAISVGAFNAGLGFSTVRRECFEQCGLFDERIVSFQDWDMWFAIAHKYEFRYVPEVLTVVGHHLGSRISQAVDLRVKGIDQLVEKWGGELDASVIRPLFTRATYYNGIRNCVLNRERGEALRLGYRLIRMLHPWRDRRTIVRIIGMLLAGRQGYVWLMSRKERRTKPAVARGHAMPTPS